MMLRTSQRGFTVDTPESLRAAFLSRTRQPHALVHSCAWIGDDSELYTFGSEAGDHTRIERAQRDIHAVALRYWDIKGPENVGSVVVGFVYDSRTFGLNGIRVVSEAKDGVDRETNEDWMMRLTLPERGRRSHADIAVVGGELVRASFVDGSRSVTPIQPTDMTQLIRRLTVRRTQNKR